MSIENTASAIINFLSKFIDKDNWILLLSVIISCFAGAYSYIREEYKEIWWLISIGVLCASLLILKILSAFIVKSYTGSKRYFQKRKERNKLKKKQLADRESAKLYQERKCEKLASDIWSLVEYATKEKLEDALTFFDLPLSDGNPLIRYLAPSRDQWCKEYENYNKIFHATCHFSFHNNRTRLLVIDQSSGNNFVKIDKYFYILLSHYSKTGKWEKLKYPTDILV